MKRKETELDRLLDRIGVSIACTRIHARSSRNDAWAKDANHWHCTLKRGNYVVDIEFSQGAGHTEAPRASDVVACMCIDSDAASESFEDFCGATGVDTDSRRALDTYLACQKSGAQLARLLGSHLEEVRLAAREW